MSRLAFRIRQSLSIRDRELCGLVTTSVVRARFWSGSLSAAPTTRSIVVNRHPTVSAIPCLTLSGSIVFRFGAEYKAHSFNSALPEEQATEFEKYDNITQLLRGVATEADTQFGITEKRFRMRDMSAFFADDFKLSSRLTLNLGVRWEWFGWPEERDGHIGNFDPSLVTNPLNPLAGFIVPSNVNNTGFVAIDTAVAATSRASTKHTLNGQDLNNFAPRFGFAYTPFQSSKFVIRGGYGIFYDRPSAAFINTIFSNYPFLREEEVTFPASSVPLTTAWSQQDPNFPFNQYLPNRIVRTAGATGTYQIRDGTNVTLGADGTPNPIDPSTGADAWKYRRDI